MSAPTRQLRKRRGRHSRRPSLIGSIATFISFVLVGWIAVTNVQNSDNSYHSNTAEVISSRQKRIAKLQKDIDTKAGQLETLQSVVADSDASANSQNSDNSLSKLPALQGEGVTVTLNDSPKWDSASKDKNANPNDYVVHQQDVEAVVNAMWAGGAEAITVQNQRLQPTSAIKCVGNVLLLNGKQYAPPYKISAIGNIDSLRSTIDNSEAVKIYKQYVEADGLGWQLEENRNLRFPEVPSSLQPMKYAVAVRK
ncbi:DUF881 domain-containing protein [Alloscardovia omnicolens]|uniref:DUF881 domain-containing protein n=1 Tax=Alloscardovia omnicolens TaxID=419015 RepID=UPI003A66E681